MSELLTWDGEALDGPIKCEDLSLLRHYMVRGENLIMPGAMGQRPYAPLLDALDTTLVWKITGATDHTGTPHLDPTVGVEINAEFYRALFMTGGDPDTGEHTISLAFAGDTFTGTAQCWDFAPVRTGPVSISAVVRVVIPTGELT